MDNYLILKLIHILSAVVLAGTGFGIAFFMFMAGRAKEPAAMAVTARHVVLADWLFTAPAIIIQFVTGVWLMAILGYSFHSPWFFAVIGLFLLAGACWIPVVVIQYKIRDIFAGSVEEDGRNDQLRGLMKIWTRLGIVAFAAILILFWLMVFKPLPVTG